MFERGLLHRRSSRCVAVGAVASVAAALVLTSCSSSGSGSGDSPAAANPTAGPLATLIAAAKKEGTVTLYTADPQNVAQTATDAFTKQYGIKVKFVRLPSAQLEQRYASEASTGKVNADLIDDGGVDAFANDTAIPKGWGMPIQDAKLPALTTDGFPKEWIRGGTAIGEVEPWIIAYNTDSTSSDSVPKTFQDIVTSGVKGGKVILPDPRAADAYVQFWQLMDESYGDAFLTKYAKISKLYASGAPATAALGAGDEAVMAPTTAAAINDVMSSGAPVKTVTPDLTSGAELGIMLTATAKAAHPNAAKLLANYLLSKAGAGVVAKAGDAVSVWDTASFPAQYKSPEKIKDKAKILSLLGLS